jgi:hypothetical protein
MLIGCLAALSLAVLLGACILAGVLRRGALVHGFSGALGLTFLVLAWRQAELSGPFAGDAVVLLGAGLCGGLLIGVLHRLGRPSPGLLLFLHASAGGLAYLLLAGFVFRR